MTNNRSNAMLLLKFKQIMKLIDKDALVTEIENRIKKLQNLRKENEEKFDSLQKTAILLCIDECKVILSLLNTLEVKEVGVWKTIDNINLPQADKNKIYCVFTNDRYILATVINHPKDEDLLQWKCTEFPFHRYDMCEGDKYMQIV